VKVAPNWMLHWNSLATPGVQFTALGVAPIWEKRGLPSGQAGLRLKSSD
jgi:hypothetical protein